MRSCLCVGLILATLAQPQSARADDHVAVCADQAERAQELRDSAKLVEAREALVACAQRECPDAVRSACTEWLADLERRIPSIVVAARDDDGGEIVSFRATLDGVVLPDSAATTAFRADPGAHVLRCEAQGFAAASERVTLREAEGVRVVSLVLHRDGREGRLPVPLPSKRFPVLTYVLGGASLISFGIAGASGISGAAEYRRLEEQCAPGCAASELDGVRARFLVADVALAVGVAALGGAVLAFVLHGKAP